MDGRRSSGIGGDMENQNDVSRHHHQTPSKRRVNLGTPANYYFKYMNSSKKSAGDLNTSVLSTGGDDNGGDTGTISIPGLHVGGGGDHTETSYLSMAATSSSGSEASDLLNKSTLSDTTELTASNFVLVTTSKQQLARSVHERQKTERELKAERALEILMKSSAAKAEQQADPKQSDDLRDSTEDVTILESAHRRKSIEANRNRESINDGDAKQFESKGTIGLRDSSPSLRSRISSSPASLRKFHEDLRNSRMKRQMQREEDAKRRLSTESASSIPFMHAQLEALTTDTNYSRQRLPPPFTQPSQFSQESMGSTESSPVGSVAASNNESTSFVNMDELDELLGIANDRGDRRKNSSITAHHSSIVQALGTHAINISHSEVRAKETESDVSKSSSLMKAPQEAPTWNDSVGGSPTPENSEKAPSGNVGMEGASPKLSSPPASKFRRTPGSRSKLTPGRMSAGPKRIVNPQSIFSPAKNTRSAKKIKSHDDDKTLGLLADETSPLMNEGSSRGERTTEVVSTSFLGRLSTAKSVASSHSGQSDETASLGDIEELFGKETTDIVSPSAHLSNNNGNKEINPFDDSSIQDESTLADADLRNQETASIGDIREILGQRAAESRLTEIKSQHRPNDIAPSAPMLGNNLATHLSDPGDESKNRCSNNGTVAFHTRDENGNAFSQGNTTPESSQESNQSSSLPVDFASPSDDTPTTPPKVDLSAMSPSVNRLLSQSKTTRHDSILLSAEKKIADLDSSMLSMKDPMRLVPNSHIAPTPTRLAPTPRRVLNPNNPNSPARNTRSASRSGRSPLAEMGSSSASPAHNGKRQERDNLTQPAQLFQEEAVVRSSKRRRSSVAPSSASIRDDTRPHGILSSRKKPFSTQRSVAFGSPKAAEYNVGSPSVSLTPMPRGRAKALFRLPSGDENNRNMDDPVEYQQKSRSKDRESGSDTMEIESDLNVLVDKITVDNMNDSPELSPIAKSKSDTGVYNVEVSSTSKSPAEHGASGQDERTVELELGMDALVENAMNSPTDSEVQSPSDFGSSRQETSMEMTDAETIASMHSRRSEKFTTEFALPIRQKLDFSVASPSGESSTNDDEMLMEEDEGVTVELETEMASLINANKRTSPCKGTEEDRDELKGEPDFFLPETSGDAGRQAGQTVDLEANMTELIGATQADVPSDHISTLGESIEYSPVSTADQKQKGGATIELEGNMTELLAVAGRSSTEEKEGMLEEESSCAANNDEFFASVESPETADMTKGSSRRKSIASKSFALHQPDQLAVSTDDVEHRSIVVNEKSVSFCDTAEFIVSEIQSNASPLEKEQSMEALTEEQIEDFGKKLFQELKNETDSQGVVSADTLSRFGNSSGTNDVVVFERLRQFVGLVCTEVEKNTDPEGTALESLKLQIEEEPALYSTLNKRFFENQEHGESPISLHPVIENGRKAVDFEWNDWLKTVLQSFQAPLDGIPIALAEDFSSLNYAIAECERYQELITKMNDKKAENARKRSLDRRRRMVADLENEIKSMESQLSEIQSHVTSLGNQETELEAERGTLHESCQLATNCEEVRLNAEGTQKAYLSLRGLHSWSLGAMGTAEMKVSSFGFCLQTSSTLSYDLENPDRVVPRLITSAGASITRSQFRYQGPLSSYLNWCMRQLSKKIERQTLSDASAIGRHAQKYGWLVGRLDLAARELHLLQKRYRATIVRKAKDSFSLRLRFETRSSCVEVEFPLDPMYPSFPVEVRLELISGELDFAAVRKSLIKQAKPGFGSLSRACDIVESFVMG